jgi:hypothetical protein
MNAILLNRWPHLWLILIASVVSSAPVPVLNVADLVEKSDVVAMGRVTFVVDAGPVTVDMPTGRIQARTMAGEMLIDQILKGPPGLDVVRFQFSLPEIAMGFRGVTPGGYRILFLKSRGDHYEFVSPYHPSIVAISGARVKAERPVDRVVEAVAEVLRSRDAFAAQKREAIDVLRGMKSTVAISGLRSALQEGDRITQLNAAAALLASDDVSALPVAEAALLRPEPGLPPEILLNLRGGISRGLKAEAAVPALARLLGASDPETRRAAATALGHTKSSSALRPLARALDDAEFEVRLNAVRGLAEISGQTEWLPSGDAFRADEERYVRYWKARVTPQ